MKYERHLLLMLDAHPQWTLSEITDRFEDKEAIRTTIKVLLEQNKIELSTKNISIIRKV